MGIRYERDTRRATNGPLIFFSDPSAQSDLALEIRGAIKSRLSFYAYRRPGDMMVSFGSSEGYIKGIGTPGFVIAPFLPDYQPLTIPYTYTKTLNQENFRFSFPEKSTSKEEYFNEIEEIQKSLKGDANSKIVGAKVIVKTEDVDAAATFGNLSNIYPDAFIFCFATPETGVWIGASPELLLEAHKNEICSMALAGTRLSGTTENWDEKNKEEQAIVATFIENEFQKHGFSPSLSFPFTKRAGKIEHICTLIKSKCPTGFNSDKLESLLKNLSPTPALCGYPRNEALKVISETEKFQRAFYGGYCGPYHSPEDFTFNVILRCAWIDHNKYALYSGGGITSKSIPEKEWEETEQKADTLSSSLILSTNI